MNPFAYPAQPHQRRHAPRGYARHESFRDWLRDEFAFRCVYCLNREQWVNAKGPFAIDHFVPTSINPNLALEYDNLLYACVACNLTRGNQLVPNPLEHLLDSTVDIKADGLLRARSPQAEVIVETLHLNDRAYVVRRERMLTLLGELEHRRPDLHAIWLGYPDELPDLGRLRPPAGNGRREGLDQTHYERKKRGELPVSY